MLFKPFKKCYAIIKTNVRGANMDKNSSVYFNEQGEAIGKGFDGTPDNLFAVERVLFDAQQVKAIKLIIQKYNDSNQD